MKHCYYITAFNPYGLHETTYYVEAESYAEAEAIVNKEIEERRMNKYFKTGEYIIYQNGERYELGRIISLHDDGAFVCYHDGETAAKTPYDSMHKLMNGYTIKETTIGGERFNEQ